MRRFKRGDIIWLRIPHRGKLDPRWEGKWSVSDILSDVNLRIEHQGGRRKIVHINRVRQRYLRDIYGSGNEGVWSYSRNGPGYSSEFSYSSSHEPDTADIELSPEISLQNASSNTEQEIPRRSNCIRRLPRYLQDYELY